jgi:hypothetical protein
LKVLLNRFNLSLSIWLSFLSNAVWTLWRFIIYYYCCWNMF